MEHEETDAEYRARARIDLQRILGSRSMDCGEMLEVLAGLGHDASLLFDDQGHWAMSGAGFCTVNEGVGDWSGTYTVESVAWRDSPREAILRYARESYEEVSDGT